MNQARKLGLNNPTNNQQVLKQLQANFMRAQVQFMKNIPGNLKNTMKIPSWKK